MKNVITLIAAIIIIVLMSIIYNEIDTKIRVNNDIFTLQGNVQSLNMHKKYDQALKDSNKALKRYPNAIELLFERAQAYNGLKNYSAALDDYNLILSMKDERSVDIRDVYLYMSYVYSDMKDYQKAIDIIDKAIGLNPKDSSLYFRKGNIKFDMKDYAGAIAESSKAIKINPYERLYYISRANSYKKLNDEENRQKDETKANELEEYSHIMHDIHMLVLEDKNKEALEKCNEMLKIYPQSAKLIKIKAEIFVNLEDYDAALNCYNTLETMEYAENFISKSTIYQNKAYIYHRKEDNKTALKMINKAIEYDKTHDDYLYSLRSDIKEKLKDYRGAIKDCTIAIKYNPYKSLHYFQRAMLYSDINDEKNYNVDMKKYDSF